MIVVGGAAVAISQLNPQLPDDVSDRWTATAQAFFGSHNFSFGEYALAILAALLAFAVLLRVLSVALALLQYWGFRLEEHGRRLTEIGRASCRERVCQYVWIAVVAVSLTKKQQNLFLERHINKKY